MKATEKRVNILTKAAYLGLLLSGIIHILLILFPNINFGIFIFFILIGGIIVGLPAFLMILDYLKSQNNVKPSALEALMKSVPNRLQLIYKVIWAYMFLVVVIMVIYNINSLLLFPVGAMFLYAMAINFCHILKKNS